MVRTYLWFLTSQKPFYRLKMVYIYWDTSYELSLLRTLLEMFWRRSGDMLNSARIREIKKTKKNGLSTVLLVVMFRMFTP